jgi:hypothetical protein
MQRSRQYANQNQTARPHNLICRHARSRKQISSAIYHATKLTRAIMILISTLLELP